jgi:hypothetical protein
MKLADVPDLLESELSSSSASYALWHIPAIAGKVVDADKITPKIAPQQPNRKRR